MNQLFGYKNIKGNPLSCLAKLKPPFQAVVKYIENDSAIFLGGNIPREKRNLIFENPELLMIVVGNIYFKKHFSVKYQKYQEFQDEGIAATTANLYWNYGPDIIADLSGDFILIIQEKVAKKITIVRDKMGGRKLYYAFLNGNIIFSSKIKSLLRVPGVSRNIDNFAIESFLKFGYIIAPNTIFNSIKELEPGHLIEINRSDYKILTYWNLHAGDEIKKRKNDIREMLYEKIEEKISVRIKAKERIGIYLSGGIDSNTLLAFISKIHNPKEIETMSIGYGEQYKDYHELNQAQFSANYFGSNHHELINGPEHIDKYLCKTVWEFEQPFGNPALISWAALSELANNLVDVVFIGAGADEVLGGYKRYNALILLKQYYKIPYYALVNNILKNVLGSLSVGANHYNHIYRLHKFFDSVQSDILKTNEVLLFGDYDSLRKDILLEYFLKSEGKKNPTLDKYYQMANTNDCFKQIFIADCYTDLVSEQIPRALIPLDKYAIDYRAPFSDPEFMTMCINIPNRYKMNLFESKIIYKEAVSRILPEKIIKQKKRGMSHPVGLWFQGPLHEALKSIVSSNNIALKHYFNIDYLRKVAEEHYNKKRDWGKLLWQIIVFSMWHKMFIENNLASMPCFSLKDLYLSNK